MKTLILAAGLGSRLQHKTQHSPKALVRIHDKPILAYQLDALSACGMKDIGIVLGYQGEMIKEYIEQNYSFLHTTFFWNHDYASSNSSYSFWMAKDWIADESYIHLNCDILFSPTLLQKLLKHRHENVIAIKRDVSLGGRLEHVVVKGEQIQKMSIEYDPQATGKAFGLAKLGTLSHVILQKLIATYLAQGDKNQNYFGMIRHAIHQKIPYYVLDATHEELFEVNTLEDYKKVEEYVAHKKLC
ncbi:MAG: hypothetical protein A3I05_05195 [Deltaproteobacteria bacterium RIFCSPLOWO2_02_FULL_44_10]|nr:MAG: hypothetical protein A3C46_05950 [Deltaproteobacteria bacterium RIFCSPHIGHO2_02_FULL_44_16]OGQ45987.1 MAG: hypothetical protein A3I05_05195 [Deltaproteobacteria bacterium RIFCSPLOWO2_02_FULL_44_10]